MLSIRTIGASVAGAAAIGLSVGSAAPAHAATITYGFAVNTTSGRLAGNQYNGTFSLDDAALSNLTGSGVETISPTDVSFVFDGATFTKENDVNFPNFPVIAFLNGNFLGLDYLVQSSQTFQISSANFIYDFSNNNNVGVGTVAYTYPTPIPTPALIPGLLGMSIAAWRKRKSEQAEQVAETIEV